MGLYSGIDLHSTNNYLGVSNEEDKRLYKKKLPNDLDTLFDLIYINPKDGLIIKEEKGISGQDKIKLESKQEQDVVVWFNRIDK